MRENQFGRFQFQPFIINALNAFGFYEPTEIQERMIPLVLKGESAIGQSQTGTGKTLAYLLPILEKIRPSPKGSTSSHNGTNQRTCNANLSANFKNY